MSEQDTNNPWETGFQPPTREVQTIEALLKRIEAGGFYGWNPSKTKDLLTNEGEKEVVVGVDYAVAKGAESVVGGNFDQLKAIAAVFGEHPGNLLQGEPRYVTLEANGNTTTARLAVVAIKPPHINTLAMTGKVIDAIKPEGGEVVITELFQRIQDINLDQYI